MAISSNDDVTFQSHWKASVGGGSPAIAESRSIEGPAPHGISLENGILQISAWIGKEPASGNLFSELCNSARRMLSVLPSNGDSFEEKFRDILDPSSIGDNAENGSGKKYDDVDQDDGNINTTDDSASRQPDRDSRPRVTTVVIHLICHPDCVEGDLSDWSDVFIPRNHSAIRVVVKVVRANISMEDIPVNDAFSASFESGSDRLTVALVRFGSFRPLLDRGNAAYAANVRSWLGSNTVTNARLKEVFEEIAGGAGSPTMFPLNHNGVSICCDGMEKTDHGSLCLVNPQIINGQQTLCGWWNAYNEETDPVRRARLADLVVMVRIVKTHLKSTLDQITFANNRQNAVSAVDLRSNEACMKAIESAFDIEGSKCLFQRKKGIDKRKGLDARVIFETWKLIADEGIGDERFFDDKPRFNSLFVALAGALARGTAVEQQRRRNRLIGLWQFSRLNFGKAKRTAIADVLQQLGVNGATLGDAVSISGDGPTRQRRLVYALWPLIQQGMMHVMLKTVEWDGVGNEIKLLEETFVGKGKRAAKVWKPTAEIITLLEPLSPLPSTLITEFMDFYRVWVVTEGYDEKEWDPEVLFAKFVSEAVTLDEMLRRMGVERADLVTDL